MDGSGNSLRAGPDGRNRRVVYYYDNEIGKFSFGPDHSMKPLRIEMAHSLLVNYGVHHRMEVVQPPRASFDQLCEFHSPDYVAFLGSVTPETKQERIYELNRFNMHDSLECPVFNDLYSFCQISAGGSIASAVKLNKKDADITINWAGGLHHARQDQALGFCHVNDIVLAILELLKHHGRVLYIDIDVHHGDGVEMAFSETDRVMTVSFHQFSFEFFPGTGKLKNIGQGRGKYYSLNVPLKRGINDNSYHYLFKPIISKVMSVFQPDAVVLQCGADSLYGDKLGSFNLSVKGHAECVRFLRSFNVPLMLLGGGGYTISSVARCWCYETGVAVDLELDDSIPNHDNMGFYEPEGTLHFPTGKMYNENTRTHLDHLKKVALDNLSKLVHAPSVQFSERRPDTDLGEEEEEDMDVHRDHSPYRELKRSSRAVSEPAFPRRVDRANKRQSSNH